MIDGLPHSLIESLTDCPIDRPIDDCPINDRAQAFLRTWKDVRSWRWS
jgi:hypothetical protein